MKTLLFYFSDIHLTGNKPESEGAVIDAFCKDFKKQLLSLPHDDTYVLIGGDLVFAADDAHSYDLFWENIIKRLLDYGIRREHIICVPGNHDIQREWVQNNAGTYAPVISQSFTEEKFNSIIGSQQVSMFTQKFEHYDNFINKYIRDERYNLVGYPIEINEEWSVYCLNSALTSFAGVDNQDYPLLKDDTKKLNIDTRKLYDWLQKNSKKKILMMHHPIDYLSDWASEELAKLVKLNFDLVLTGHTHRQDIMCNKNGHDSYIWCKAPQLYSDKTDKQGYCIIELCDNRVDRIIYREWFESRNSFRAGLDFTEEEDGIIIIENHRPEIKDVILLKLEERFKDTMAVYGDNSLVWIDRFFSLVRFDRTFTFNKNDLYSEDDIIQARKSLKIITPAQYGLSSFAWHFLLKIWKEQKSFGLYLDCGLIKKNKVDKLIESQLREFDVEKKDVEWLVFDNWSLSNKDAKQILTYLDVEFKNIPIMILCPMLEKSFIEHETISNHEFSVVNMYMAPMQMSQLRKMVDVYNQKRNIGEGDVVLKRLKDDIQNFNMHRTPLNCISLLEVFSSSFDENPVNRTAMIEKLLRIIFDNETVPSFKSLPDVKDCEFALGYYCEQMIKNEKYYFSSEHFYDTISGFCRRQKITLDINYLFAILLKNQILCQYDVNLYGFRFSFWVYYFGAMRMTKSPEFAELILSNENYARYPEMLEFYTGSDRTKNDAAEIIINDINKVTESVHHKVGFADKLNPFQMLKFKLSDEQVGKAIGQLDEHLKNSKLPNNIKDALDDKEYNPSKPYHQEVCKVWENYSVNYLQEIIGIASKTLRNSDYIRPELKEKLLTSITEAWYNTIKVVYLMAPALAVDGQAGYDDFRLALSDTFKQYKDDPKRMLIKVVSCIPLNILHWYKDDIYSAKLADLIFDRINTESNSVIKHVLVSLVIYEQPEKWDDVVRRYLSVLDKNSYYYGDTIDALCIMYSKGIMSEANAAKTRDLILLAYTKVAGGGNRLNPSDIKHINKDLLPQRNVDNEE